MFVRVWAGERDLVTILASTISYLMYCTYLLLWTVLQFVYLILVLLYLVTVLISIQLLLNQHNGEEAPQNCLHKSLVPISSGKNRTTETSSHKIHKNDRQVFQTKSVLEEKKKNSVANFFVRTM